ncbi:prefoldin subunit 3-like [Saccoglossus kowalevskii]|uniref:Prefoldin subunit 3 n=1 Tax=Saccoglossus kowalevskii TaxID=10224 RepID=A0ABM0GU67_SACKO|nr:PREDICTED: prefoldin subunit 3-like [Saccoglossus kowalevskii]
MADKAKERPAHGGIPEAIFVEDVEKYMKDPAHTTAETVLQSLDEQHQKYKFMELNLLQKKKRLMAQIPDIRSTLDIVKHLQGKKTSPNIIDTHFLLAESVYAKSSVEPTDKVCLWLGANVMLEYEIDDAQLLLEKNLTAANNTLYQVDDDLDFLRDQYTTTEVNMARVYNWDVKRRQAAGLK